MVISVNGSCSVSSCLIEQDISEKRLERCCWFMKLFRSKSMHEKLKTLEREYVCGWYERERINVRNYWFESVPVEIEKGERVLMEL
jgi:hypothetical protein